MIHRLIGLNYLVSTFLKSSYYILPLEFCSSNYVKIIRMSEPYNHIRVVCYTMNLLTLYHLQH